MNHMYEGSYFFGWGWILWFGFVFLVFSSIGNWGYSYRAHRKYDRAPRRDAAAILNERYASGEIDRVQYLQLKTDITEK